MTNDIKILRIKQLSEKLGIGCSTIYDWLNPGSPRYDPTFPKSVKLGLSSKGWLSNMVDDWLIHRYEEQNGLEEQDKLDNRI